ncbi:sensor histidine kinase [Zavarzinia sp. CC-PAN008]|uniref:sensor histidine kinase n=1 Tax=Zavarzinia sp. CC-PAN008 TaxID=3243332 RepID=UPI003F743A07
MTDAQRPSDLDMQAPGAGSDPGGPGQPALDDVLALARLICAAASAELQLHGAAPEPGPDQGAGFHAAAALPGPDGEALGVLRVSDRQPRPQGLSPAQADGLKALARLAAAQLPRAPTPAESRPDGLDAEALRERLAQKAGRTGTFELDLDTDLVHPSPTFLQLFGLPPTDGVPATEVQRLIVPDDSHIPSNTATRHQGVAALNVEYRIRRADDGALRWIARRAEFLHDAQGRPVKLYGVVQDVTERKLAELRTQALAQLGAQVRDAGSLDAVAALAARILGETLGAARAGYAAIDTARGAYRVLADWVGPAAPQGTVSVKGDHPIADYTASTARLLEHRPLVVDDLAAHPDLAADVAGFSTIGTRAMIVVPVIERGALVGSTYVHDAQPRAWTAEDVRFAAAVADRLHAGIAKLRAEDEQRILNEELSHRLKNTVAIVQALATQTLKTVTDRAPVQAFLGRLVALSRAHDVLVQQHWLAADIRAVARGVISIQSDEGRFTLVGPDLRLTSKAALSVAMLLHELATNATKHGALSVESGHVRISWQAIERAGEVQFRLDWEESGGPPARFPTRQGFGFRLIQMGLSGSGNTEIHYGDTGLRAGFVSPWSAVVEP